MAYGDPYCGKCHKWMSPRYVVEAPGNIQWSCECPLGQEDTTKDPNCHNSRHDHHDPHSPIVLSRQAEYAAERQGGCICIGSLVDYTGAPCPVHTIVYEEEADEPLGKILPLCPEVVAHPWEETLPGAEACGHYKDVDGVCTFWGCPTSVPLAGGTPFFDTIDELDEILEDTNQQVEVHEGLSADDFSPRHHGPPHHSHISPDDDMTDGREQVDSECLIAGHVWVRMGKTKEEYEPENKLRVFIDWGPPKCLRCGKSAPEDEEEKVAPCVVHSYTLGGDNQICDRCGLPMGEIQPAPEGKFEGPKPLALKGVIIDEPKHACPGCNLRDLTMKDAKEHIRKLLIGHPNTRDARAAEQWMRLTGKIRAWEGD